MDLTPRLQEQLESLLEHFTGLEDEADGLKVAPAGFFIVMRADGIKASKHFLKDTLEQPDYHNALHDAVGQVYRIWRNWAPSANRPYLLGALRLSDEVSLFVNRGDNYFARRLLKITSTLASTLSGSMTLAYASRARGLLARAPVMAFDGRPLLLEDGADFVSYIRCRRLLHARNAMARVLRLKSDLSDDQLYEQHPRLASDLYRLGQEIKARGLWPEYEQAAAGSALYLAQADGTLEGHTLPSDPTEDEMVRRALGEVEIW